MYISINIVIKKKFSLHSNFLFQEGVCYIPHSSVSVKQHVNVSLILIWYTVLVLSLCICSVKHDHVILKGHQYVNKSGNWENLCYSTLEISKFLFIIHEGLGTF